ncbi:sensor histidine kinase [Candidatus Stoquefichus massiliensis]|uniref:sensor histidine kinase n=1 Tax=Candidatus Stoquefichus massiliensis TaxID=1470350 RepID=UPI000485A291|nr:HAMP domain-containing sensor histidine kinase [Candidatus Stoquefichus massiliensis]
MKRYNYIIVFSIFVYLVIGFFSGYAILSMEEQRNYGYRVESHRILNQMKTIEDIEQFKKDDFEYILDIDYLHVQTDDPSSVKNFFDENYQKQIQIIPFYHEQELQGYIKFIYQLPQLNTHYVFWILEGSLLILEILILIVLFDMRKKLIQPFQRLSHIPLQLAKGHFKGEVKEEKSKYFGQFMWGIGQLKDSLDISQKRQLELLKEKKEMLLSLSHDMKTPLNLIKLYSKALEENIYTDKQTQIQAIHQIGEKASEIENYVEEIIKSSREDILNIQVKNEDFYLQDLMEQVLSVYDEQCALWHIELIVHPYDNKIVNGDKERCQEVFENLFENAFKYGDGRQIEISFFEEDYCQLIRIFNTGTTVSDTEFNHLFDSFFRGSNSHGQKGSGLGLYICRELMQKMDGAIYAEKCEDGMAFVVVIR